MNNSKCIRVYLSPANHFKPYAIQGYTEKQQMDKLSVQLSKKLMEYQGVEVVSASVFSSDRSFTGRPEEAKALGCDVYVALHSNAGGGKGACVFYHPSFDLSKRLAYSVVKELNGVCPIKSNRAVQPAIYPWNKQSFNFGELRLPAAYGIVPILIEHEFHDTVLGAKWIINNIESIATADAKAIAKVLGLNKKAIIGDINGDGIVDNIDAQRILSYDAGVLDLSTEQLKFADVNGDGKVDNRDAITILMNNVK